MKLLKRIRLRRKIKLAAVPEFSDAHSDLIECALFITVF